MADPIVKTIDVGCDAARAFDIFVNRVAAWWPLDRHAVSAVAGKAALGATIEPRVGGAVFETMHDGTRADWGEVLVFEPGARLAMSWHPGADAGLATRVEVAFEDVGQGRCRVRLTHSGWEVRAERADAIRGNYDAGWDFVLGACFAAACR